MTQGRQKRPAAENPGSEAARRQSRAESRSISSRPRPRTSRNHDRCRASRSPQPKPDPKPDPKPARKARQAEAARIQARPDRQSVEEGRRQESPKPNDNSRSRNRIRRNSTPIRWRSCSTSARRSASLPRASQINDTATLGAARREGRRSRRARSTPSGRAFVVLESAARLDAKTKIYVVCACCMPDGSLAAGRLSWEGRPPRLVRLWPRARCARCCCAAFHDAQARALRSLERPGLDFDLRVLAANRIIESS